MAKKRNTTIKDKDWTGKHPEQYASNTSFIKESGILRVNEASTLKTIKRISLLKDKAQIKTRIIKPKSSFDSSPSVESFKRTPKQSKIDKVSVNMTRDEECKHLEAKSRLLMNQKGKTEYINLKRGCESFGLLDNARMMLQIK